MERKTLKVCITGAAGNIGYSFLPMIASGQVFGEHVSLQLFLLEVQDRIYDLQGIKYELEDGLYPNLDRVEIGTDPRELFKDVDFAILLGGSARQPGMDRKDLLGVNSKIFKSQGQALNDVAKPSCKVLVVANPCNTNCLILQKHCPNIPKKNFTCLNRLDHNRAVAAIAKKAGVHASSVKNMIVWGNHSDTQYPDINFGTIDDVRIDEIILDEEFLKKEFISHVQKRGGEILSIRKKSPSFSGATAVRDHLKDWYFGTKSGEWVSMGVYSDGSCYDIPEDLFFSLPVYCRDGEYQIVKDLDLNSEAKERLLSCIDDLIDERSEAFEEVLIP